MIATFRRWIALLIGGLVFLATFGKAHVDLTGRVGSAGAGPSRDRGGQSQRHDHR